MTFTNSYLKQLQRVPKEIETHNWADFVELLCLANIDGEVSEADVIDRVSLRQRDLAEGNLEDIEDEKDLDSDEGDTATNRATISDRWELRLRDMFLILSMRSKLYKEFYPFAVSNKELQLRSKKPTSKQKLYVYLLLCSNLYLFPKRESGNLANAFEVLCADALRRILPERAEVHLFGQNPFNKSGEFNSKQTLWDRMNKFAKAINESVSQKITEEHYPADNRGDEGLDIVAWIPTDDELPSKIVFLGQCACGKDWINKQGQSSFDNWSNKIDLTNYSINNIFIPYCYRKADGGWHKPSEIRKTFLIDRKRLLEFCFKEKYNFKNFPVSEIVEEIFKTKEAVF